MMAGRANEELAVWFERSGFSQGELARLVVKRAQARGLWQICTDTSRVHYWLTGQQPRPPVPEILAEVFSERFGCSVTIADLGFEEKKCLTFAGMDIPWELEPTLAAIDQLTRSDLMLNRRDLLTESANVTVGAALIDPLHRWITATPRSLPLHDGSVRIGMDDVRYIVELTEACRKIDRQHGGKLPRKVTVSLLNETSHLLNNATYTEKVGRCMLAAMADLAMIAGWTTFDVGLHATAQRYFVLGLHAAKQADDQLLGAEILACMARQMFDLNRPQDALDLIQLALYGVRKQATPAIQSMLHANEAWAFGELGQAHFCQRAVGLAEDFFTHAQLDANPNWLRYYNAAELAAVTGDAYRSLVSHDPTYASHAATSLKQALDNFSPDRVLSRAFHINGLVSAYLLQDEIEQANTIADQAIELTQPLTSTRINQRMTTLRHQTTQFKNTPHARELHDKLNAALP